MCFSIFGDVYLTVTKYYLTMFLAPKKISLLLLICSTSLMSVCQTAIYSVTSGNIAFKSEAPLELIQAASSDLKGAINVEEGSFAFSVDMRSFEGFNSPLQREHFNENYMESKKFPKATFIGKIIEKTDFAREGEYTIRAKGRLTIHGVSRERIIKSQLKVSKGKIYVQSNFTVLLDEHDIAIPKIVHQKIAEEIFVKLDAELAKL